MDESIFELAYDHIEDLHKICASDLSLAALQEKIDSLDESDIGYISQVLYAEGDIYEYDNTPFLHYACMNKNVTVEIIKCLMDTFPDECRTTRNFCASPDDEAEAYPLHLACCNEDCPSDVIRFLVEQHPEALKQLCVVDDGIYETYTDFYIKGLPIHYYLARNCNVDINTVKMMVEACPQSLVTSEETEERACYPINALLHNQNIINLQEVITLLIELEPSSVHLKDGNDSTPLHLACENKNVTLDMVQFISNAWPEAIRMRDIFGCLPIHNLCINGELDDDASLEILHFIISIDATLAREVSEDFYLPIHHAVACKSSAFCRVLLSTYPESIKLTTGRNGFLPIHSLCSSGGARTDISDTLQYLLEVYPGSINFWDGKGWLPIHRASTNGKRVEILETLLMHDPNLAKRKIANNRDSKLPLHIASRLGYSKAAQVLYDAYPKAMTVCDGSGRTPLELAIDEGMSNEETINFLRIQLDYVGQAQDTTALLTPDEEGCLPIHRALLQGDASLGSIKLLVGGNTNTLLTANQKGVLPLHIACGSATSGIVQFLADSYDGLDISDSNKDYPLHYACQAANLDVIKYFLDEHTSLVSSAEVNCNGELPIHLLCEAGKDKDDIESTVYTEVVWRMLLANPETVVGV